APPARTMPTLPRCRRGTDGSSFWMTVIPLCLRKRGCHVIPSVPPHGIVRCFSSSAICRCAHPPRPQPYLRGCFGATPMRQYAAMIRFFVFLMALAVPQVTHAQKREVGSLLYDGIPEVPKRIGERAQPYQAARGATLLDWEPGGAMLIATRFGDTNQVHRVA